MSDLGCNGFHHGHNRNGTHDSICTCCYMTVATVTGESEAHLLEDAHICDPVRLDQMREDTRHALSALQLGFGRPQVREMPH